MKMKNYQQLLLRLLFCLASILIGTFAFGQVKERSMNLTTNFECNDNEVVCPEINLIIYNGLNGATGGQVISEDNEEVLGALTVANLNDTDGDGTVDINDINITASPMGRDEVDLMRLDIESVGIMEHDCNQQLSLEVISGAITFWQSPTKNIQIQNLNFDVAELPLTIYIEATQASNAIRDIEIVLQYDERIQDRVRATAIWAEITRTFRVRGNEDFVTPIPDGLPNNPHPFLDLNLNFPINSSIINLISGRTAMDNSRYGFGPHPLVVGEGDCNFGGRILFEFIIMPNDIALNDFGINFDIGRKRNSVVLDYPINSSVPVPSAGNLPWPVQTENCNDDFDPETENGDEDRIFEIDSRELYSYDAPSAVNVYCNPIHNYKKFLTDFEEFVRFAFNQGGNNPYGGNTDAIIGSRISDFIPWNIDFTLQRIHNPENNGNPFDINNHKMAILRDEVSHSFPVMGAGGNGDGNIEIELNQAALTRAYSLLFHNNSWFLYEANNQQPLLNSNISENGPWVINLPEQFMLRITNGPVSFTPNTSLFFTVYRAPVFPIINQLN